MITLHCALWIAQFNGVYVSKREVFTREEQKGFCYQKRNKRNLKETKAN